MKPVTFCNQLGKIVSSKKEKADCLPHFNSSRRMKKSSCCIFLQQLLFYVVTKKLCKSIIPSYQESIIRVPFKYRFAVENTQSKFLTTLHQYY